jgi:hypothetical protein
MLSALLSHLETYLNDGCPLQELERWLVAHLQEILDARDQAAIELANQIDAALVEFSAGVLDEVALRQQLDGLLRLEKTISLFLPNPFHSQLRSVETGAGGATITEQLQVPGRVETLDLGFVAV